MQTHPIIIGTAGHIDHGKTSLVRALTGIDTDRLKVEKERGITTELGFAHLDLGGRRFGVVDVPGHERFIKAMVAGAVGLDLVCLVIAADEGIMPQTREHLDICELLGVRRGIVVLTKADLVDAEWLELVSTELRETLAETFLAEAPIVPVSALTGLGLDVLQKTLLETTRDLSARSPEGPFRLPIDRVFTVKGFGTVVTGTVQSGTAEVGDEVELAPRGLAAKIRGIEVHGDTASRARAGMRCAINLAAVATEDVARGDTLIHPGGVPGSHIIDCRFRYLKSSRGPLARRSRVLIHHGTTQRAAALVLVDRDELAPGEETVVQLRLDASEPLMALPGDHFIARGFVVQEHYGTTIGGGEIVRVQAAKVRRSAEDDIALVTTMADADQDERIALEVQSAKAAGRSAEELAQRTGLPSGSLGSSLQRLVESGVLLRVGKGKTAHYEHAQHMAVLEKKALDTVTAYHEQYPERRGIPRAELRSQLPPSLPGPFFEELLLTLVRRGAVEEDKDVVHKPGKGVGQGDELSPLEHKIARQFAAWRATPERLKVVPESVGEDPAQVRKALQRLLTLGILVKVNTELYFHQDTLRELQKALVQHLEERGEITPAEWKDIVGASRKFTIPLAEHFDREKVTLRVGEIRKLRA